jgi:hypothetical protein
VYLYEAAVFPGCEPIINPVPLRSLGDVPKSAGYTLYIPPAFPTMSDPMIYARMRAMAPQSVV